MGSSDSFLYPQVPFWNLARKYAEEAQFTLAPSTRELLISLCGTTRSVENTSAAQSVEWLKEWNVTLPCPNPYHDGMSEVPWVSDKHTDRHTYTNTRAYTNRCISMHMLTCMPMHTTCTHANMHIHVNTHEHMSSYSVYSRTCILICTYKVYACTHAHKHVLMLHTPQYTFVVMYILCTHKYTELTHARIFIWIIIHLDIFVCRGYSCNKTHTTLPCEVALKRFPLQKAEMSPEFFPIRFFFF